MTARTLDGQSLAKAMQEEIRPEVAAFTAHSPVPLAAVLLVLCLGALLALRPIGKIPLERASAQAEPPVPPVDSEPTR